MSRFITNAMIVTRLMRETVSRLVNSVQIPAMIDAIRPSRANCDCFRFSSHLTVCVQHSTRTSELNKRVHKRMDVSTGLANGH